MAMFSLRQQANGSVAIESRPWGNCEDRVYFRNEIPMGDGCFGLNYEELILYAWIETTDEGLFADGGKVGTGPWATPPLLRKTEPSNREN